MNRDEILKMEAGRELDALVAEHLFGGAGATWFVCPRCKGEHFGASGDGRQCHDEYNRGCAWYGAISDALPPFSTDIAAAWEVVDALSERNIHFAIFTQNNVVMTFESKFDGGYISEAGGADDSIALAICRAALLAVMEFDG